MAHNHFTRLNQIRNRICKIEGELEELTEDSFHECFDVRRRACEKIEIYYGELEELYGALDRMGYANMGYRL